MTNQNTIIQQSLLWVHKVVMAHQFCPFAAKEIKLNTVRWVINPNADMAMTLENLIMECQYLDNHQETSTTLIILPEAYDNFDDYLDLTDIAEQLLEKSNYEGIYQIASFHPDYCFADAQPDDPANFTNRSPYPMLHILREDSITDALNTFPDPESIPEKNVQLARNKGLKYFEQLLKECKS